MIVTITSVRNPKWEVKMTVKRTVALFLLTLLLVFMGRLQNMFRLQNLKRL